MIPRAELVTARKLDCEKQQGRELVTQILVNVSAQLDVDAPVLAM